MLFWDLITTTVEVHANQLSHGTKQRDLSKNRLIQTIDHACTHVPYYREKFKKAGLSPSNFQGPADLKKLPFLTKSDVRGAFPGQIVADKTDINACHFSATTGSTGKSLPFLYSPKTFAYYLATNLRVYTMIGYRPWHRCSYIKYTPMAPVNIGPFFVFNHIPSVIPVERQIAMLRANKPDFIDGYASIIYEIARRVTKTDLRHIRPKMILVNSEMSTEAQRNYISETFHCPVYDEYSTEETWMIASQCKHHRYHLFTDNVWVEFLDKEGREVAPGELGEMVLTTLNSPAMPFIRYKIGDMGRLSTQTCPCGSPFPVLETFEGRADDAFTLPDGTYVSSLKILNTFTMFIKKYLHLIEEFKVIQKKRNHVVIELVKGKAFEKEQFQEVIDALSTILTHNVKISVETVTGFDFKGGIKRKAIESWVT